MSVTFTSVMPAPAPPAADRAERMLLTATAALEQLRQRRDFLADAIADLDMLRTGELTWEVYNPDLYMLGGEPQEAAIAIAEGKVADAVQAVTRTLAEYHGRAATEAAR